MTINTPAQAVAFALAQARWTHAYCLNFAYSCYVPDGSVSSNLGAQGYPPPISRAIDGWNGSPMKHTGDRNPPVGALVYYSAASSGATAGDGHVAIYVGGGMIRSTDAGGYGVNATVPLDWPERNWGRHYLGWTGDVLGHPMFLTTTPASIPGAAIHLEDDMPIKYEIIAGPGDPTHYVSFNRAGRYPLSKQTEADYQYWLKTELGYSDAQVAVKSVKSLASFGPILRDAKP
jgi:hypothetical protein